MMNNPMIKWGLYYGGASILLTVVYYFVAKPMLFGSTTSMVVGLALAIFFVVMAMKEEKEIGEGYLGYGEALKVGLGAFVLGSLLVSLFQWVLFNFIDTSLIEQSITYATEQARKMTDMIGGMAGMSEEQMEELVAQTEEEIENMGNPMSMGSVLSGWALTSLIGGLPLNLITAAIMKKS